MIPDENIEMVIIPKAEYESLLERDRKLEALESYGVDNWCGYGDAMAEFYSEEEK